MLVASDHLENRAAKLLVVLRHCNVLVSATQCNIQGAVNKMRFAIGDL